MPDVESRVISLVDAHTPTRFYKQVGCMLEGCPAELSAVWQPLMKTVTPTRRFHDIREMPSALGASCCKSTTPGLPFETVEFYFGSRKVGRRAVPSWMKEKHV